jgi:hypothetical protein
MVSSAYGVIWGAESKRIHLLPVHVDATLATRDIVFVFSEYPQDILRISPCRTPSYALAPFARRPPGVH